MWAEQYSVNWNEFFDFFIVFKMLPEGVQKQFLKTTF